MGLISGSGWSPGIGNGLENPIDRWAWQATGHGVTESDVTEWQHRIKAQKDRSLICEVPLHEGWLLMVPSLRVPATGVSSLSQDLQENSLEKSDMPIEKEGLADYLLKLTGLSEWALKMYHTENCISCPQRHQYLQKELLPTPHAFSHFLLTIPII